MKKIMFFALAAAGLFASCTSDDVVIADEGQNPAAQQNLDGREVIKIGLGNVSTIMTKGTGTVGGVKNGTNDDLDHNWKGQAFRMFMFKHAMNDGTKGALTFNLATNDLKYSDNTPADVFALFNNDSLISKGHAGMSAKAIDQLTAAAPYDSLIRYYPNEAKQAYDFIAYRADDSVKIVNNYDPATFSYDGDSLVASFKIDGSQDVLLAKSSAIKGDGTDVTDATELNNSFSAWSSRHNIYPMLNFQHMLTRFTVEIQAGDEVTAANVKVDSIAIFSKDSLAMTLAYADALDHPLDSSRIVWAPIVYEPNYEGDLDHVVSGGAWLKLKQRDTTPGVNADSVNLVKLDADQTILENVFTKFGEALMVNPSDSVYKIRVYINEDLANGKSLPTPNYASYVEGNIKIPANHTYAKISTSYNVRLTIFGHKIVTVETKLEPWTNGGDIDVNEQDNWTTN
ncbi:MAG: fimbrillin family protein [Prevotella sp.]|nr:fimbrillin family protein [Prevotella sp.]